MPRNASGTYTLPAGNPVDAGTVIEAAWANSTLEDLGNEITNSLSRTGEGGMLAPFRLANGTLAAPGIAWLNEPSTGFYRAGAGEMWGVVSGSQILQYTANGILIPAGKTFTAQGNVTVGGTLSITGAVNFTGNAAVGGTLGVTGATTLSSTLAVTGAITATGGVVGNVTGNVTGNVSGNAGTVTNGVYTTGTYADPAWITSLAGSKITGNISGNAGNVSGTVAIANGGTGQTTANAALNALLPSQATQSGKYLKTDGTNASWDQLDISTADITGTLPLANGGTNATTAAAARTNLGLAIGTDIPSPTGTGASGTWGINVSGNAATVTNGVYTNGSYADPSWITSLAGSKITGAINNVTIGQSTAAAGSFTTLSASTSASLTVLTSTGLTKLGASTGSESLRVSATSSAVNYVRVYGGATGTGPVIDAQGSDTNVDLSLSPKGSGNLNLYGSVLVQGGTANGVAYLNGSKVLTTGSALQFNGTDVGLGGSPVSSGVPGQPQLSVLSTTSGRSGVINWQDTGNNNIATSYFFGSVFYLGPTTNHPFAFFANGSEQMRLTSTGLGIGTSSPAARLSFGTSTSGASDLSSVIRIYDVGGTNGNNYGFGFQSSTGRVSYTAGLGGYHSFYTANTERMRLDPDGNLGLGVTPSASWNTTFASSTICFKNSGVINGSLTGNGLRIGTNWYYSAGGSDTYLTTAAASRFDINANTFAWQQAASGTAGNTISFTQAMTLDASGNLLVGDTTNPGGRFYMKGGYARFSDGTYTGLIGKGSDLVVGGGASDLAVRSDAAILFSYGSTERARITSGGFVLVNGGGSALGIGDQYVSILGTSGSSPLLATSASGNNSAAALFLAASTTSYTSNIVDIRTGMASGTGFNAITYKSDTSTTRFVVAGNGDVTNTNNSYGAISDAKMKTDIVDAGSQWADIKAVRFRKFKMKDDPEQIVQLGVVAQELEQTSPGLVDEHIDRDREGNDLGTTTKSVKTSVLLMKAAVALQEAMARIEQLEAKVAALEAK